MDLTWDQHAALNIAFGKQVSVVGEPRMIDGDIVVTVSSYGRNGSAAIKPDGGVEIITPVQAYVGPYSREADLQGL
jgi:hypothetical protein